MSVLTDPDVMKGLLTAVAAGLMLLGEALRRHVKRMRESTEAVRYQVQNSHETNLREDLDLVIGGLDEIRELARAHGADLRQLRDDLNQERKERYAIELRVDDLTAVSTHRGGTSGRD